MVESGAIEGGRFDVVVDCRRGLLDLLRLLLELHLAQLALEV